MKTLKVFKWLFIVLSIMGVAAAITALSIYRLNFSNIRQDAIAFTTYQLADSVALDTINLTVQHANVRIETHSDLDVRVLNSTRGEVANALNNSTLSVIVYTARRVVISPHVVTLQIPQNFNGALNVVVQDDGNLTLQEVHVETLSLSVHDGAVQANRMSGQSLRVVSNNGNINVRRANFNSVNMLAHNGNTRLEMIGETNNFTKTLQHRRGGNSTISGVRTTQETVGDGDGVVNLTTPRGNNTLTFIPAIP